MWCCDDWWAHACGGTAAAGRSLSRFSLRALGRHTHARTHASLDDGSQLVVLLAMCCPASLSGGASRGPLSEQRTACLWGSYSQANKPTQVVWSDPIHGVCDRRIRRYIWSGGVCVHGRHIHSYRKRMACSGFRHARNHIEWLRSHGRGRTRLLNTAISIFS